jgi:hypothetical protein
MGCKSLKFVNALVDTTIVYILSRVTGPVIGMVIKNINNIHNLNKHVIFESYPFLFNYILPMRASTSDIICIIMGSNQVKK